MTTNQRVSIARQPIFDTRDRVGFELLYRGHADGGMVGGDVRKTARTAVAAVLEFGLDRLIGSTTAWLNVSAAFIVAEHFSALPNDRVILDIVEIDSFSQNLKEALANARSNGYRMSVGYLAVERHRDDGILDLVDYVRVDAREPDAIEVIAELSAAGHRVVAEKVETQEQRTAVEQAGASLFQGYFFAKPDLMQTSTISPSALTGMKLLPRLADPDATFDAVIEVVSADPVLAARVLVAANSSYASLATRVESVHQAVLYVGADRVRRMAMLSLLDGCRGAISIEVMRLAALRAELCRQLAGADQRLADMAFTCGLLSVLDVLLGEHMSFELLRDFGIGGDLSKAISGGHGQAGYILGRAIVMCSEADAMLADDVNPAYLAAIEYADNLVRILEAD